MKLYGIWCKDLKDCKGDWMRELPSKVNDGEIAILAFTAKRTAQERAAEAYGYDTYSQARRDDWVEVRQL